MSRGRRNPLDCPHDGPVLVSPTDGGYAARCLLCGTVGPERRESEEARRALTDEARGSSHGETGGG